jgi:tRNA 5-methylaminomethyl-2-thiouridine biosynthesis bifunctional protein
MQYTKLHWLNGEPYSEQYDDVYYSVPQDDYQQDGHPGEGEFNHVFFSHNGLPERWQGRDTFTIAELGFGSGLNFILTISHWLRHCESGAPDAVLNYIAIEQNPVSPDDIRRVHERYPELSEITDELLSVYPPAIRTLHMRDCFHNGRAPGGAARVRIFFCFMPAYIALSDHQYRVDAWYLDGFSPAKNQSMWTAELFAAMYDNSSEGASFSTYTAAGYVRRNLEQAGFSVEKVAGYGRKRDMLRGLRLDVREQDNTGQPVPDTLQAGFHYHERPWSILPARSPAQGTCVQEKHAIVIGAGIAGLAAAWSLVQRGWRISLVDREAAIAQQTSANPAAVVFPRLAISDIAANEFNIVAFYHAIRQLDHLQHHATGERFWYQCGLLQCLKQGRLNSLVEGNGFEPETIRFDHDKVQVCESWGEETAYLEDAGYVIPQQLCQQIRQQCGAALEFIRADITQIGHDDGSWCCYSGDVQVVHAEIVILATNHDCNIQARINSTNDAFSLPVDRYAGTAIGYPVNVDSMPVPWPVEQVVNAGHYIVPPDTGNCYIGATYSDKNRPVISLDQDVELLLDAYAQLSGQYDMPAIDRSSKQLTVWNGVRGTSPDRMPVIGPAPDLVFFRKRYHDIANGNTVSRYPPARYHDGIYYSVAHGSRGFTTSFLAGEMIAAMVTGGPLPVSSTVMRAVLPSRFIVNDLKRGRV